MKKIMVVFGTRPEAIKMAPVIKALKAQPTKFEVTVCVTAQHRAMLDQILDLFSIAPDFDLNIMQPRQDLYDVTGRVLMGMRDVFEKYKPDWILVHGDTTTAFAAALAAFYAGIKIGHVEAGLRTNNLRSPYPEEGNRQLISRIADMHFAPTDRNRCNLLSEGVDVKNIVVTGNTVVDALLWAKDLLHGINPHIFEEDFGAAFNAVQGTAPLILVTAHRRENFGEGIRNICKALLVVAEQHPEIEIVYPVHPNPNIKTVVESQLGNARNIHLIKPLSYAPFIYLMNRASLILTDSGGVQEEAPSLNKQIFVLREETERPEAVSAGAVQLIGTNFDNIIKSVNQGIRNIGDYKCCANPYGDGNSSSRIVSAIANYPVIAS